MACNTITTGQGFVSATLAHIDCQAQTIGSLGFAGLGGPGSPASQILTAILAIFVAIFGIRLLLGYPTGPRDIVMAFLKIGIVLALATSWPAFRTVIYDTVLYGPAEIAGTIGAASDLPGSNGDFAGRLQTLDNAVHRLTATGSGRWQAIGSTPGGENVVDAFRPIAVSDDFALGAARVVWLSGTIGSLAVVRLGAGLLLALAPLFAMLLLFAATRPLFFGWLRGLGLAALGALAITIVLAVEMAVLEPWLASTLSLRASGYATPSAPTELLVLMLAFSIALFGIIAIIARVMFAGTSAIVSQAIHETQGRTGVAVGAEPSFGSRSTVPAGSVSRAHQVVEAVEATQRRERLASATGIGADRRVPAIAAATAGGSARTATPPVQPLGDSFRRTSRRSSSAIAKRDGSA